MPHPRLPPSLASVHRRTFLLRSWESRSVLVNKLRRPKRISHLHRPDWHSPRWTITDSADSFKVNSGGGSTRDTWFRSVSPPSERSNVHRDGLLWNYTWIKRGRRGRWCATNSKGGPIDGYNFNGARGQTSAVWCFARPIIEAGMISKLAFCWSSIFGELQREFKYYAMERSIERSC